MSEQTTETNWWKKSWKWIASGILALAAIGDAANGFQIILGSLKYMNAILYIPTWIPLISLLICLVLFIITFNHVLNLSDKVKNLLGALAIVAGILLAAKFYITDPEKKFVIVYDDETVTPISNLGNINIESKKIDHLFQLYTTGQLDNAIFISTVSRPEIKWKEEFPSNTKLSSPIFSVQQVIDKDKMSNLVDISLSDFAGEISNEIKMYDTEIRIFYEKGFEHASDELKTEMSRFISPDNINEIKFDKNSIEKVLSKKATIVFLGNSKTFKNSIHNINSENYNVLFVPNWIRPNIDVEYKNPTNRICALSKTFDKLMSNDFETWKNIVDIIKDEDFKNANFTENIKTKIRSKFATSNQTFSTHF